MDGRLVATTGEGTLLDGEPPKIKNISIIWAETLVGLLKFNSWDSKI